jgi:hypothetical protein
MAKQKSTIEKTLKQIVSNRKQKDTPLTTEKINYLITARISTLDNQLNALKLQRKELIKALKAIQKINL